MTRRTLPVHAVLLLLLAALVAALPVLAQENAPPITAPFLDLLARVPASAGMPNEDGNVFISYADYRALEAARPGVPSPERFAAFNALVEADDFAAHLWLQNGARLTSGWPEYGEYLFTAANLMPEMVGFDFFTIDRALNFNQPPAEGTLFGGEFDPAVMAAAYAAGGYTETRINDVPVWCGPDGCDEGAAVDLVDRYLGRVFGDHLGRQQPVVFTETSIFSSPAVETLDAFTRTASGAADSLLDVPAFRAIAEAAVAGDGTLLQAEFLHPAMVGFPVAIMQAEADMLAAATAEYGDLPAYELAALLDRQEGPDQVALVALVYADEASALAAAAELSARLATQPFDLREPDDLLLDDDSLNARLTEPTVFTSETAARWVALAGLAYSMPDNTAYNFDGEPVDDPNTGSVRPSGQAWRVWIRQLWQRTFTPLLIELPAAE